MDPRSQQPQGAYAPGQYTPGGLPASQPAPGVPYIPQHGLAQTAANIQPRAAAQPQQPSPQTQFVPPVTPQPRYQQEFQPVPQPYSAQQFAQPQPQQPFQQPMQQPAPQVQTMAGTAPGPAAGAKPGVSPVHSNPNSTQNMLQIAEIRDGIVIMNDGSFRSVVMIKSINFDLMSRQEQEAIENGYQSFLNSLYFPIQIFIRSQKVDLQPYIDRLDKIRSEHDNMLLALLMEDYIGYIDALAQQTNIMDKKFYIIIPFFPVVDVQKALTQSKTFISGLTALFSNQEQHVVINEADLESAKTELRNRVQAVLAGLMQCGIQGLPLDTQELIELFYDTYNPDTATRQQLKNFNSLTADVITKGQGQATQPHLQRELG